MAVDRLPVYRGFTPGQAGVEYPCYAHVCPSIDYLERAFDYSRRGWYSEKPFVSPIVPSNIDGTIAPEGEHVVLLSGGHAPYQLMGGDWARERDYVVKNVFAVMDEFAPGFSDSVLGYSLYLHTDLEEVLGMPRGHELHGDVSLDQLFFKRPAPHYANCRSPVRGLYQCGSSTHPAGSVSAVPGHNAARAILKDYKRLK